MDSVGMENSTPKSKNQENRENLSFASNLNKSEDSSSANNSSTLSDSCGTGSAGTTANSPTINRHLIPSPERFNKWNLQANAHEEGATGGGDANDKMPYNLDFMTNMSVFAQMPENLLVAKALDDKFRLQKYGFGQERYSRKVFVGGLPPDIDEHQIAESFKAFGPLKVDWPHKSETRCPYPPKGFAFLLFQLEQSVQQLISTCVNDVGKFYMFVSSPTIKDKSVQIRPWRLADADFQLDPNIWLDPRKTVFVGGVPRQLKASELALILNRYYGNVCYASIESDPEHKYPKGAARVCFSEQHSYIAAISARFVQLHYGDIEKRVEVKPYVLDDQICDECKGLRCGGKFAPFFCASISCLEYYCEQCWIMIHSRPGREFHKPLVKESTDRSRPVAHPLKRVERKARCGMPKV